MKKTFSLLFFVLILMANAFASEVISKEAVNYYNQGLELQKISNFEVADSMYEKALILDPTDSKLQKFILNNRGVMLALNGRIDEAELFFNKALQIDKNYLPAKLNLGFIYEQRGNELESIKYWLKVLNINLDKMKPKGYLLEDGR